MASASMAQSGHSGMVALRGVAQLFLICVIFVNLTTVVDSVI